MKGKKIALSVTSIVLIGSLTTGVMVNADHKDHDEEYGHYKKYQREYRDEDFWKEGEHKYKFDDDDYDWDEGKHKKDYEYEQYDYTVSNSEQGTWNIWTRTTTIQKGNLPFNESQYVTLKSENGTNEIQIYAVPRDGELFVPGKAVAKSFGASAKLYKTSQILEVKNEDSELIFRANTNVAYQDGLKTPLPSVAFYLNSDVYIPISAITNGLGYSVEWQEQTKTLFCRPFSVK